MIVLQHVDEDGTNWAVVQVGPCPWCNRDFPHAHVVDYPDLVYADGVLLMDLPIPRWMARMGE